MSALNPQTIQELAAELSPEIFTEILRTFRTDLGRLCAEMSAAAAAGQLEEYRRAAHGLAGAAGSVGARTVEALARRSMNRSGGDAVLELLPDVEAAVRAALDELAMIEQGRGQSGTPSG